MFRRQRRNKYNVAPRERRTAYGIVFDSRMEMMFYLHLLERERKGEIRNIELQPRFELLPKPNRITYIADFRVTNQDGTQTVFDVKGRETPVFKLKKKMMRHFHPNVDLKVIK